MKNVKIEKEVLENVNNKVTLANGRLKDGVHIRKEVRGCSLRGLVFSTIRGFLAITFLFLIFRS